MSHIYPMTTCGGPVFCLDVPTLQTAISSAYVDWILTLRSARRTILPDGQARVTGAVNIQRVFRGIQGCVLGPEDLVP